ncbi:MAG TPA: cytochrome c biogenesis heme-transporting ATPase CcmA [Burkholderiales bacterium]|nr:cytochrome c biogenesis heme-transporting ATPase CcmA [Burkholderiales bacterium]
MLETTALGCERGGLRLFSDLGFAVAPGNLLRVRGSNGSGKTTLLRTLAGLTRPAAGAVRWKGREIDDDYRGEMLFLGHTPALKAELTVIENLEFSARLAELKNADCRRGLRQLGIERLADLPASYLSQGQQKRAALARLALAAEVPLWLLDEPFSALDEEAISRVSALCAAHLAAGGMLVLTSHQDVPVAAPAVQTVELRG